jgi:hypothetical protein
MIRLAALAMAVLFATLAPSFGQVCNDDVPPPPPPAEKPVT